MVNAASLREEFEAAKARVAALREAGVGVPFAQAPFLGPKHHRAQDFECAVGHARSVPAHRVEPRGHVLGADVVDVVERHPAKGGRDPAFR